MINIYKKNKKYKLKKSRLRKKKRELSRLVQFQIGSFNFSEEFYLQTGLDETSFNPLHGGYKYHSCVIFSDMIILISHVTWLNKDKVWFQTCLEAWSYLFRHVM